MRAAAIQLLLALVALFALAEHRRHWSNTPLHSISFHALRYWWRWR